MGEAISAEATRLIGRLIMPISSADNWREGGTSLKPWSGASLSSPIDTISNTRAAFLARARGGAAAPPPENILNIVSPISCILRWLCATAPA